MEQSWSQCFKILDDIKETVRLAAIDLARILTKVLIQNLESSEGRNDSVDNLLKTVIPFILSPAGLESSAKEVQALSLHTLLEIIKKGKPSSLRPFVPNLLSELVAMLTSFEPEVMNYAALNSENFNLKQSDIDDVRLKSIRSSPIMEALERALDVLDEATMAQAAPKLQEAMRSAVGEPSKVGSSRMIVSLSTRKNYIFRPFADQFLSSLEKRVVDRNDTVSSSYAASMGYVARLASDVQILKTVKYAQNLYFGVADNERPRYVAIEIVQAIAKYATDRFNALAADILPFVFFGRFDDAEHVRELFKETYNETVSGSRVVSLYLSEMVTLARSQLQSAKWTFKHAAAQVLAAVAQALADSQGSIQPTQAELLWPALETALAEKSWDGKERVLEGFVVFVEKSDHWWQDRAGVRQSIRQVSLDERVGIKQQKKHESMKVICSH